MRPSVCLEIEGWPFCSVYYAVLEYTADVFLRCRFRPCTEILQRSLLKRQNFEWYRVLKNMQKVYACFTYALKVNWKSVTANKRVTKQDYKVCILSSNSWDNLFTLRKLKKRRFRRVCFKGIIRYKCCDRSAEYNFDLFAAHIQELLWLISYYAVFVFQTSKRNTG